MTTDDAITPDAFGATIFCDDIRFEMDGKVSLIGSYGGDMFVRGGFPVVLPKFAASILFVQRKQVYSNKLELKIYLPGDENDKPFMAQDLAQAASEMRDERTDTRFIITRANMVFSPLRIEQPGNIKIRIVRDGVTHGAGSLRVLAAPQDASAPNPSSV